MDKRDLKAEIKEYVTDVENVILLSLVEKSRLSEEIQRNMLEIMLRHLQAGRGYNRTYLKVAEEVDDLSSKVRCKAKKLSHIKRKGKPSIEWHDREGNPQYYCCGYVDFMTEELMDVCFQCKNNVHHAQEDLENYNKVKLEKTKKEALGDDQNTSLD